MKTLEELKKEFAKRPTGIQKANFDAEKIIQEITGTPLPDAETASGDLVEKLLKKAEQREEEQITAEKNAKEKHDPWYAKFYRRAMEIEIVRGLALPIASDYGIEYWMQFRNSFVKKWNAATADM